MDLHFTNLLIVVAAGFVSPLVLGLFPRLLLPSVVLEIVAGIVVGPHGLGLVDVDLPVQIVSVLGLAFLLFLAGLEIDVHRLRVIAKPYGVVKVDAAPGVINITFRANPPIEAMRIIELVQKNKHIKLAGNDKLRIEKSLVEVRDRAQMVRDVLKSLGQPKVTEAA